MRRKFITLTFLVGVSLILIFLYNLNTLSDEVWRSRDVAIDNPVYFQPFQDREFVYEESETGPAPTIPPEYVGKPQIFLMEAYAETYKHVPCFVTNEPTFLPTADAIVMQHYHDNLDTVLMYTEMWPAYRSSEQLYVLFTQEAPNKMWLTDGFLSRVDGQFNRTMTYRADADYLVEYGSLVPGNSELPENFVKEKKKSVLWLVSHCNAANHRDEVASLLEERGLVISQFGACNSMFVNKWNTDYSELAKYYRFYLAFENINCVDYITEKLWRPLTYGLVPIVYGGGNYSRVLRGLDKRMVIDIRDYPTPEALVRYIEYLEGNMTAYAEYHEWRKSYVVVQEALLPLEKLCAELMHPPVRKHVYHGSDWIPMDESDCNTRRPWMSEGETEQPVYPKANVF